MFILILFFLTDTSLNRVEWGHVCVCMAFQDRELTFGGDHFAALEPRRGDVLGTSVAKGEGVVFMRWLAGCG